jgi:hypothetical protein
MDVSTLQWTHPVASPDNASRLLLVISPFATRAAMERLFETTPVPVGLQVVTTWSGSGLLAGACDPELYPFLKSVGGRLYLHSSIHLKLYILSASQAVLSTGNLTLAGLGLSSNPNIELSTWVTLQRNDWQQVDQILQQSQPVTDLVYDAAKLFLENNPPTTHPVLNLPTPTKESDDFSYLALPATRAPDDLWLAYERLGPKASPSITAEVAHDLNLFGLAPGLSREAFFDKLGLNFRNHSFIVLMVEWLKSERSASFGKLKAWIHENCNDRPTPFRRDLTIVVQGLFEWLPFFHPEISWSTPGQHSQVMYWNPLA